VGEVVEVVLRDRPFYETSGGGVTLSGGEPLLQLDFACEILARCRAEKVHTAIETAANVPWARIARILPVTDLVMMDVKVMDEARHREVTGVSNRRILANARRLGQQDKPLIVRTPVIPGVNDDAASIAAIAEFVAELPNLDYYELLRFHGMAKNKYDSLEMDYRAAALEAPPEAKMDALTEAARGFGIDVRHS
jgi:pyruvate formate lyase activating enzyme